jgi:signal transduction histidine kinase
MRVSSCVCPCLVVTHILNDVLSLQKVEDGALTLDYRVFHIETMLNAALYSFKAACTDKSIKIKISFASLDEAVQTRLIRVGAAMGQQSAASIRFGVLGDLHRLRQVCSNLMSNGQPHARRCAQIHACMHA